MDYLHKYRGQDGRKSVYDILSLDPNNQTQWEQEIKPNYVATDIHKVKIGGNTFTNYGDFQFAWEKSYVKSPTRSADGSIGNLNSYATFVTPHLIINFSVMSIDDYRQLMRLDLEQNEFVVECYDPIYNKKFKGKMYFGTPQMAKLLKLAKIRFDGERWEEFVELVGVQEYTVELIGTNAEMELISVIYHLNPPTDDIEDYFVAADDVYSGEDIIVGNGASSITQETFGSKYKFSKWNVSPANPTTPKDIGNYVDGWVYTINQGDMVVADGTSAFHLYAQWTPTEDKTLTFVYGVADSIAQDNDYEMQRLVIYNQPIGLLPHIPDPVVEITDDNGKVSKHYPYKNGGWYKTPTKAPNSQPLSDNTAYWSERDSAIYLLYEKKSFTIWLYLDKNTKYGEMEAEYGSTVVLPQLENLEGWYIDALNPKKFSGVMPPYSIPLIAKFKG